MCLAIYSNDIGNHKVDVIYVNHMVSSVITIYGQTHGFQGQPWTQTHPFYLRGRNWLGRKDAVVPNEAYFSLMLSSVYNRKYFLIFITLENKCVPFIQNETQLAHKVIPYF